MEPWDPFLGGGAGELVRAVRDAGPLDAEAAGEILFRSRGRGGRVARAVILALAGTDPRLRVDEEGRIALAPTAGGEIPLRDSRFVVVDVETTGMRPGPDRVTELAAVRVEGGELRESFTTLLDCERPVPPAITQLTGIDAAMLRGAPTFARVAPAFLEFLGVAPLVAHHARFDTGFLDAELERCGQPPIANPVLCTVKLSRRLLPGLPSRRLDALARHYGLHFRERHRALGDAEVTAGVLLALLDEAAVAGIDRVDALLDLARRPPRRRRRSRGRQEREAGGDGVRRTRPSCG